jgi:hypothetical protein
MPINFIHYGIRRLNFVEENLKTFSLYWKMKQFLFSVTYSFLGAPVPVSHTGRCVPPNQGHVVLWWSKLQWYTLRRFYQSRIILSVLFYSVTHHLRDAHSFGYI